MAKDDRRSTLYKNKRNLTIEVLSSVCQLSIEVKKRRNFGQIINLWYLDIGLKSSSTMRLYEK